MNQEEIVFPTNKKGEELAPYMLPLIEYYLSTEGETDFPAEVLDTASSAFLSYLLRRSKYGEPEYNIQLLPRTEFQLWKNYASSRPSEPLSKFPIDSIGYETVLEQLKDYVNKVVWPATLSRFDLPTTTLVAPPKEPLPWFTKAKYRYSGLFGGAVVNGVVASGIAAATEISSLVISVPVSAALGIAFIATSPYSSKRNKKVYYVSEFGDVPEDVYTYILECKNILANNRESLPEDWEIVLTQNYRLVDSE